MQKSNFKDLQAGKVSDLPPRERILRTALDLFYEHGVHSVGIDRIIAESGVAKMTFYRHFPSKAKLVAKYLSYKSECWQRQFDCIAADDSKPALDRLLGIFDALKLSIENPAFRGCPFIKGLVEFGPDRDEPEVQQLLSTHFVYTENLVTRLLKQIRPKDWKKFVHPVLSLICGSIIVAQASGRGEVASRNKELVRGVLTP